MTIRRVTRIVYGLIGLAYVLLGAGSMLLPTGWLPQSLTAGFLDGQPLSSFTEHLLQEFGTVVIATGSVFLWQAGRTERSRLFHWAMTFYFSLDALIHWIGPGGIIGSWPRGILNSIPLAVMLLLGLLLGREARTNAVAGPA